MDQSQLEDVAKKIKNKTATAEETLTYLREMTDLLENIKNDLKKVPIKENN